MRVRSTLFKLMQKAIMSLLTVNKIIALLAILGSMVAGQAASADENLFESIHKRGVVRIGVGYQAPPMNYIENDGEPAGFDIDLAKAMAEKMGLKSELVRVNNKTRISFLFTGQVDAYGVKALCLDQIVHRGYAGVRLVERPLPNQKSQIPPAKPVA